jgi:2-oxoglutarate ferredoxin oxidoreductase subunit alpha
MVMTDHVLASSYFTIEPPRLRDVNIDRGDIIELSSRFTKDYKRHLFTDSGISPRAFPLQAQDQVVCTDSDEHDESGHLIEDSETRKKMVDKRMAKMSGLSRDVLPPVRNGPDNPDILLIGWGSTRGAIDEAAGIMSVKGIKASSLHLGQVWPFPEETVSDAIKASRASFVIENNASGQLSRLIMTETGFRNCKNVMRYDGRPFSPLDIVSAVTRGPN